ncbi:MAG TPA: DUF1385 domain-containing protein [Terriglobales bacterium]|nr:DUF1385 domain-containing protein [Terriglobales bacterium]
MGFWRHNFKFLTALQLLPALESGEETTLVGGQAVLEGVMMRSPHAWGIAVRKPNGEIVTHVEKLDRPSEKRKWLAWPFIRGVATLGQAMTLGFRALQFSANVALEEEQKEQSRVSGKEEKRLEFSGWLAFVNIAMSLGFFIAMYKFIPFYAAKWITHAYPALDNRFGTSLIDGVIRIALFLTFIYLTSRMKDIRRVFEYHGGEHKTVFAFESGQPVTVEHAQSYPTFHPRCGTSFLMTVMLISIPIYMLFPNFGFLQGFLLRIVMLPVIAGVSYEIIRYAARKQTSLFAMMTQPGLWLQRITTQPPSNEQVECAMKALDEAMQLEKQLGGKLVLA